MTSPAGNARRSVADDGMFIVGVVGRAGSGKSSIARWFAERGAALIEADALGHQVTEQDDAVRQALIEEYGPEVFRRDGTLDRPKVAERVFRDPDARRRLDGWVHPRIVERIRARLDELRRSGHRGWVVLDAALLLEWGLERECDAVVAVVAPEWLRVARLARSRGWNEAEVGRRLAAQRADQEFEAAADLTIMNDGDALAGLEALAVDARRRLEALRDSRATGKSPC